MKYILISIFFLVSCGGASSDLPLEPAPKDLSGIIVLNAFWDYTITIPSCDKAFVRSFKPVSFEGVLAVSVDYGYYPDINSPASCRAIQTSSKVNLNPYTVIQNVNQFKEMLVVKYGWDINLIEVYTFKKELIVLKRTIKNKITGDSIWVYKYVKDTSFIY